MDDRTVRSSSVNSARRWPTSEHECMGVLSATFSQLVRAARQGSTLLYLAAKGRETLLSQLRARPGMMTGCSEESTDRAMGVYVNPGGGLRV